MVQAWLAFKSVSRETVVKYTVSALGCVVQRVFPGPFHVKRSRRTKAPTRVGPEFRTEDGTTRADVTPPDSLVSYDDVSRETVVAWQATRYDGGSIDDITDQERQR